MTSNIVRSVAILTIVFFVTSASFGAETVHHDTSVSTLGGCVPSATTLCLLSNQFQVEIDWESGASQGSGEVLSVFNDSTGFFTFQDPDSAEVLVKVFDACAVSNTYWVGLANVSTFGQTVTVVDTALGNQVEYLVTEGSIGDPVFDTAALPCAPPIGGSVQTIEALGADGALFLLEGRFQVELAWEDFNGGIGEGSPVAIVDRSGSFSIASPDNLEMLVKMVPNPTTGSFFFFLSSLTNLALDITVTDTCSGSVKVYSQPIGTNTSIADTDAFPIACAAQIFSDGFESGTLEAWTSSVGGA